MQSEKLTFTGAMGEELAARLDHPDNGSPRAYALFAHCFTCSKNLRAVGNIARSLTDENIAVFRFDFTGLGESEGDFSNTNFSSNVDDLIAAAQYMEQEFEAPEVLVGHSLGGAAVIQAAHRIPKSRAVVTIAAPSNPEHVVNNFELALDEIEEKGEAQVTLAGRPFRIKKQFLDDLDEAKMDNWIKTLDKALLLLHSPIDNTVGVENAAHIFDLARHPKSFISLDKADHLLSDTKDSMYAGTILAAWFSRYAD